MIRVENLHFQVGDPSLPGAGFALRDVSLDVAAGEYFVLLGPTGSGKSLLLECLCGLNRVRSGRIRIGGEDVTDLEPRRRRVGYLPQDYALFPHLTVRRNIAFGLAGRSLAAVPGSPVHRRVEELACQLDIGHLLDRLPAKLSGGEKQRVALARALAVRPRVLLLDEPVSALDEATRDVLCRMLKRLQREAAVTALHVCHNFAEMLAVADRVGIIYDGRILQMGTPQEVLQRPRDLRVARFVQSGNLLRARAEPDGNHLRLRCEGGFELRAARPGGPDRSEGAPGSEHGESGEVTAAVRPECVRLLSAPPEERAADEAALQGRVRDVVDLGPLVRVAIEVAARGEAAELVASMSKREFRDMGCREGAVAWALIAARDVHVIHTEE